MAIFLKDEQPFEAGTTITSKVRVKDDDGDITGVDVVNGDLKMELEVVNPTTENVVRSEETMTEKVDNNNDNYYVGDWSVPEDIELGEYELVHRATVNGDPYKLTRIVDIEDRANC